jgi:hypothetical protein
MLDFLVENKGRMWTGTTGDVYRYVQERDAVKAVSLTDAEGGSFRISIECDPSKVTTYGRPFTELYDLPLTVRVPVPESWSRFTIKQRGREDSGKVLEMDGRPVAQLDVLPNAEAAVVTMAH